MKMGIRPASYQEGKWDRKPESFVSGLNEMEIKKASYQGIASAMPSLYENSAPASAAAEPTAGFTKLGGSS